MKKLFCILMSIMIIVPLSACANSIKINGERLAGFEDLFVNKLPEEVEDSSVCCDMYLQQSKSVLGDPNYVLSFTLRFDTLLALQDHLKRIPVNLAEELQADGKTYYLFQGNK